jgi:hypothetical protein
MAYIGNSPANVGNYAVVDDIASSFNGTTTSFALTSLSQAINPAKSGQLLVSINGVLQEPDDTGADGFKVSGSNIVFSSAPASGSTFWCVYQGANVDIGTPSLGTVGLTELSATGTASSTTYLRGDNTWVTPTDIVGITDVVDDTTPQLGGNLDNNGKDISGTGKFISASTSTGDYVRMYGSAGTGKWDIYGHGANLRFSDNESAGNIHFDTKVGIGTSLPTQKLHVTGDVVIDKTNNGYSGLRIHDDSGGDYNSYIDLGRNQSGTRLTIRNGGRTQGTTPWSNATATPIVSFARGGIAFGSDTAAANTLDDYEEGTWACTASIGTVTNGDLKYTKIGRLVTVTGYLYTFSETTSTATVVLAGLPFIQAGYSVGVVASKNMPDKSWSVEGSSGSSFQVLANTTSSSYDWLTYNDFISASTLFFFTYTYYTT